MLRHFTQKVSPRVTGLHQVGLFNNLSRDTNKPRGEPGVASPGRGGSIPGSSSLHADVSLGKIPFPKLLLMLCH